MSSRLSQAREATSRLRLSAKLQPYHCWHPLLISCIFPAVLSSSQDCLKHFLSLFSLNIAFEASTFLSYASIVVLYEASWALICRAQYIYHPIIKFPRGIYQTSVPIRRYRFCGQLQKIWLCACVEVCPLCASIILSNCSHTVNNAWIPY